MIKMTKERCNKINESCYNKFSLNLQHFLFLGDYELVKKIELDNGEFVKFSIFYKPLYKEEKTEYGQIFNVATGSFQIYIRISFYKEINNIEVSMGEVECPTPDNEEYYRRTSANLAAQTYYYTNKTCRTMVKLIKENG